MARKKTLEDRSDRIVHAARELFGRYGYERTTVEDIAVEAGISKGSVYLEFPGKDDILLAVIARFMREQLDEMSSASQQCSQGYLPTLKTMWLHHMHSVYRTCHQQQHSPEALALTSKRIRSEMSVFFEEKDALVAQLLEKAALAGEMPFLKEYEPMAKTLGLALQSFFPPYTSGQPPQIFEHASELIDILLAGLAYRSVGV